VVAALVRRVTCPNGKGVSNEKCCDLFPILEDIQANLFDHGECGEDAHSALRIAFHDAIGYSTTRKEAYVFFRSSPVSLENDATFQTRGGGADGSIYTFAEKELAYHANDGIDDIIARQKPSIERYAHTLTAGDL
jgi:cytochrome c peroxidase